MAKSYEMKAWSSVDSGDIQHIIKVLQIQNCLPHTDRIRTFVENVIIKSKVNQVLEIGCGIGEAAYRFAKHSPETQITAIDSSEHLIKFCQDKYNLDNLQFVMKNAYALDYPKDKFDLIYVERVLHHLTHPKKAMFSFWEILRSHGFVILNEPDLATACMSPWDNKITPLFIQSLCNDVNQPMCGRLLPDMMIEMGYKIVNFITDIINFNGDIIFDILPLKKYYNELIDHKKIEKEEIDVYWNKVCSACNNKSFSFSNNLYTVVSKKILP